MVHRSLQYLQQTAVGLMCLLVFGGCQTASTGASGRTEQVERLTEQFERQERLMKQIQVLDAALAQEQTEIEALRQAGRDTEDRQPMLVLSLRRQIEAAQSQLHSEQIDERTLADAEEDVQEVWRWMKQLPCGHRLPDELFIAGPGVAAGAGSGPGLH